MRVILLLSLYSNVVYTQPRYNIAGKELLPTAIRFLCIHLISSFL